MPRTQADDQADYHARHDGDDRLVNGANALDLQVVRGDEGADEEEAEDAQAPPVRFSM